MPWAAEGTCPGELGRPGDGEAYCLRQGDGQVHGRLNFCCFAAKQQPGYLIVTASGLVTKETIVEFFYATLFMLVGRPVAEV